MNIVNTNHDDAHIRNHILEQGDIVILASDGLWDNISIEQIHDCIGSVTTNGGLLQNPKKLAKKLAITARLNNAKPDDITVIVAVAF